MVGDGDDPAGRSDHPGLEVPRAGGRRGHHRVGDGDDPAGRSDDPGRQERPP